MKKIITKIILVILCFIVTGCNNDVELPKSTDVLNTKKSEFCLISADNTYELNLEMPFANIKPTNVESGSGDGFKWEIYTYPDIEIKVLISEDGKKYINEITTTSCDYKTSRGIKVGDDLEELSEVYKEELEVFAYMENGPTVYMYDPEDDIGFNKIYFYIYDGVINRITLINGIDG